MSEQRPHSSRERDPVHGGPLHTDRSGLNDEYKANCVPCRQRDAEFFLAGERLGWRAHYAPGAPWEPSLQKDSPTDAPSAVNTAVQDDASVEEAVRWQVESPDG